MPEVYLATSVFRNQNFDSLATINEALTNGYNGVQLFLNSSYASAGYCQEVIDYLLDNPNLGVLLHMQNEPIPPEYTLQAAGEIHEALPSARGIVHHQQVLELPKVGQMEFGWENSVNDVHDPAHIDEAQKRAKDEGTFFVYDFTRSHTAKRDDIQRQRQINGYIINRIKSLVPSKDIIHADDKSNWDVPFRDNQCVLGEGVARPILPSLRRYPGIIVFEYENRELANASLLVLR